MLQQCGLKIGEVRNEFSLPAASLVEASEFCLKNGYDPTRPMIYLQPFTSTREKNWAFEKYLALAHFWKKRGFQILFSGGTNDGEQLKQAGAEGFVIAAGIKRQTDIALLKLSRLVIGGDTGFVHLAVALGTRVVMLVQPSPGRD